MIFKDALISHFKVLYQKEENHSLDKKVNPWPIHDSVQRDEVYKTGT
jgi:hypothetical protein